MTTRRGFLHRVVLGLGSLALASKLARMGPDPVPVFEPRDYKGEWTWVAVDTESGGPQGTVRMIHPDGHWEDVPVQCGHFTYQFKDHGKDAS